MEEKFTNLVFPEPEQDYKVLSLTNTFNQARYILDTLNGLAIQDVDFPFVSLIIDDASTDGEQNVIRQWANDNCDMSEAKVLDIPTANIIIVPKKGNSIHTFAFYLLKKNLFRNPLKIQHCNPWFNHSEYISECEGDDYWTDPLKIKRQVDFLDSNGDYSAIAENAVVVNETNGLQYPFSEENDRDYTIREMILKRRFPTAGVLYRIESMKGFYEECRYTFDSMMWCYLRKKGNVRFSKVVSSVYRRGPGITESTKKIEWAKQVELWYLEFKKMYCPEYISKKEINSCICRDYYNALMDSSTSLLSKDMYYSLKKIYQYDGAIAAFINIAKKTKLNIKSLFR